jgi:hypothetical protein
MAGAVRSIHDSVVRNINPLAFNAHAIVTIINFPIGVINALCIAAIAAGSFAAVQTLIPTVQLRVLIIVGAAWPIMEIGSMTVNTTSVACQI